MRTINAVGVVSALIALGLWSLVFVQHPSVRAAWWIVGMTVALVVNTALFKLNSKP